MARKKKAATINKDFDEAINKMVEESERSRIPEPIQEIMGAYENPPIEVTIPQAWLEFKPEEDDEDED